MKKITMLGAMLTVFLSFAALAEEHAETALKHTGIAIQQGNAGHSQDLLKHAEEALTQAVKSAEVAEGDSKTHLQAAIQSLRSAIELGKMPGREHLKEATKAAEEAAEHLKSGNR